MIFHKSKKSKIYWKLHSAGLVNQLMSIEMGCGIAFMENIPIVVSNYTGFKHGSIFTASKRTDQKQKITTGRNPSLFDLIDMPENLIFSLENDANPISAKIYENNIQYYYKCSDGTFEDKFAEGRPRLVLDRTKTNFFTKNNLAFYSRYFFSRTKELDQMLSQIKFKYKYLELSKKIAYYLNDFTALHCRLTDHAKVYGGSTDKRLDAINKLKLHNLPIVVSTDEPETLQNEFGSDIIIIDDIICKFFSDDFVNLEFHDETVFGLICLLTLSHAKHFIGTPGSTFSGLIHRLRHLKNMSNCFDSMRSDSNNEIFQQTGPFSWNGFQTHTNVKNWWREWPESKLIV